MSVGLLILAIFCYILAGGLVAAAVFEDFSDHLKSTLLFIISVFVVMIGTICLSGSINKSLKEIECKVPPQIDTVVTTKNSVSDTTYTYIFKNEKN